MSAVPAATSSRSSRFASSAIVWPGRPARSSIRASSCWDAEKRGIVLLLSRKQDAQSPGERLELERRLEDVRLAVERGADLRPRQLEAEPRRRTVAPIGRQHAGRDAEVEHALVELLPLAEREQVDVVAVVADE